MRRVLQFFIFSTGGNPASINFCLDDEIYLFYGTVKRNFEFFESVSKQKYFTLMTVILTIKSYNGGNKSKIFVTGKHYVKLEAI